MKNIPNFSNPLATSNFPTQLV